MMDARWAAVLAQARAVHETARAVREFCPFPKITEQEITPSHTPGADLMVADTGLFSDCFAGFRDALIAAAPLFQWRATYAGTPLEEMFHDRFGNFELLGQDTLLTTDTMRSFIVYQPAGFTYPWHHHPAEELYLVLAGEGEFLIHDQPSKTLRAGGTAFHASNQPHSLLTHEHPVLAYVLWRGDLKSPPEFTYPDALA